MSVMNHSTFDLLDQLYTVAYWMTGSIKKTNALVFNTYQQVDSETSDVELFRTFRKVFYEWPENDAPPLPPKRMAGMAERPEVENRQREADGKLAVLLAEVCKLKHRAISRILDKPVETIRLLLTSERKAMLTEALN